AFGQPGPRVGSFDGGYGASYLARIVGHKKAREIWYRCARYDAREALEMGLVNRIVPLERLEAETIAWCRDILANSPLALRCLKAAFNADTDGLAGLQELAGNATLLYYLSEEAREGRDAFLEKRAPDFSRFPRLPGPVSRPGSPPSGRGPWWRRWRRSPSAQPSRRAPAKPAPPPPPRRSRARWFSGRAGLWWR